MKTNSQEHHMDDDCPMKSSKQFITF